MEFTAIQSLVAGLSLTAVSVIVLYQGFGLYTVLGIYAAGHFLGIVVGLFILFRLFFGLRPKFEWTFSVKRLREGSHFFSMTMMWFIMSRTDIIVLSKNVSTEQLGLYTAAMMLVTRLAVIPQAIANSLPSMSNLHAQEKIHEISDLFSTFLMKILVTVLPGVLVVYVYSDKIMELIFGKSFNQGSTVLGVGIISFLFFCISVMEYSILTALRKQKDMNKAYIIATIFCIISTITCVYYFGSIGAVTSVVATQGLIVILFTIYGWKYITNTLKYFDLVKLLVLNVGVLVLLRQFHDYSMFLVVTLTGIVYLIGTNVLGILKYKDILEMRHLLSAH